MGLGMNSILEMLFKQYGRAGPQGQQMGPQLPQQPMGNAIPPMPQAQPPSVMQPAINTGAGQVQQPGAVPQGGGMNWMALIQALAPLAGAAIGGPQVGGGMLQSQMRAEDIQRQSEREKSEREQRERQLAMEQQRVGIAQQGLAITKSQAAATEEERKHKIAERRAERALKANQQMPYLNMPESVTSALSQEEFEGIRTRVIEEQRSISLGERGAVAKVEAGEYGLSQKKHSDAIEKAARILASNPEAKSLAGLEQTISPEEIEAMRQAGRDARRKMAEGEKLTQAQIKKTIADAAESSARAKYYTQGGAGGAGGETAAIRTMKAQIDLAMKGGMTEGQAIRAILQKQGLVPKRIDIGEAARLYHMVHNPGPYEADEKLKQDYQKGFFEGATKLMNEFNQAAGQPTPGGVSNQYREIAMKLISEKASPAEARAYLIQEGKSPEYVDAVMREYTAASKAPTLMKAH